MEEKITKQIFDTLRKGKHISVGDSLWTPIKDNQELLESLYSQIGFNLQVRSEKGYAYFLPDDDDLANKDSIRRVVGILNMILLDLKPKLNQSDMEQFLQGNLSLPLNSINLHATARFSNALKVVLKISDTEQLMKAIKSSDSYGFHKVENDRLFLLPASHRIFEFSMKHADKLLEGGEEE
jgi:hypothetical protein